MSERGDERGTVTPMIIGFALLVVLLVAVVVDASAAYLQRQELDSLADGAALHGADAGVAGRDVYEEGLGDGRLELSAGPARAAVADYLADVGAHRRFPGLRVEVRVAGTDRLEVRLSAPVDLPLPIPGAPTDARVAATGGAVVTPE